MIQDPMDESAEQFDTTDFNPDRYVKEVSHRCVGVDDLRQQHNKIKYLADKTNNVLKRNVYHNFTLFIETSKEISRLEGDMYQLSHLLSEQKSLLTTLASTSIFQHQELLPLNEAETNKEEEDSIEMKRKQILSDIAEKIEWSGCTNLTENSGRFFLYEGDLRELNAIDNTPMGESLHVFLLSDVLLLTSTIVHRRTPARYKVNTVYDVSNLAIVNVKDVKNAIKLLAFPDMKVFQAPNSQAKKEWLEKFEEAKKLHMIAQSRKRGSICIEQKSPARTNSIEVSVHSFDVAEDEIEDEEIIPDWLLEVAEDLDVLIVERHFEDAYNLIEKTRSYFKESPSHNEILVQDILGKVDQRVKSLTQILTKELEVRPEKSHQGGLRAARISVRLLNTLQKSTQACDLFLKLCSHLLKTQMKRAKRDAATAAYVKQLSALFFLNLCDIAKEFQQQAFPDNPYCASAFVVWCTKEISEFMSYLVRHIFTPQTSLAVLNRCVEHLHVYSEKLAEYGLDVTYQIDGQLRTPLIRALSETKDKLLESINARAAEERWHLTNLRSSQQSKTVVSELEDIGIANTEKYITDHGYFELTNNVVWFSRTYIHFIENLAFNVVNITYDVEQAICDVLLRFIGHIVASLRNEKFRNERRVIEKNCSFLADELIPFCDSLYEKCFGVTSIRFRQIKNEFNDSLNKNTITGYCYLHRLKITDELSYVYRIMRTNIRRSLNRVYQ